MKGILIIFYIKRLCCDIYVFRNWYFPLGIDSIGARPASLDSLSRGVPARLGGVHGEPTPEGHRVQLRLVAQSVSTRLQPGKQTTRFVHLQNRKKIGRQEMVEHAFQEIETVLVWNEPFRRNRPVSVYYMVFNWRAWSRFHHRIIRTFVVTAYMHNWTYNWFYKLHVRDAILNVIPHTVIIYTIAFPADIGGKPASPVRGSRQRLHAGESRLRRWRNTDTPDNETVDSVSLNMAVPVWIVTEMTYMRDNPKTLNIYMRRRSILTSSKPLIHFSVFSQNFYKNYDSSLISVRRNRPG